MPDHRIRLTDEDVDLIVRSLFARAAMLNSVDRHNARRLAERLQEGGPGNPKVRLGAASQEHKHR